MLEYTFFIFLIVLVLAALHLWQNRHEIVENYRNNLIVVKHIQEQKRKNKKD